MRNRLPVLQRNKLPYEMWYGMVPNFKHFRTFGCVAYALKPDTERHKMDYKSEKIIFIGYSMNTKGYRLFDKQKQRVVVRRDVILNENEFDELLCPSADHVIVGASATDHHPSNSVTDVEPEETHAARQTDFTNSTTSAEENETSDDQSEETTLEA